MRHLESSRVLEKWGKHSSTSRIYPQAFFVLYVFCVIYNRTEHSRDFFICELCCLVAIEPGVPLTEVQNFHTSTNKYTVEWISFAKFLLLLFGECKRVITEICPVNYTAWQPPAAKGQGGAFLSLNRRHHRQKNMVFILSNRISGDKQRTLTNLFACLLN